jgi:hypothetical protein
LDLVVKSFVPTVKKAGKKEVETGIKLLLICKTIYHINMVFKGICNTLHKVITDSNNNNNNCSIYDCKGVELNSRLRTAIQNLFNVIRIQLYLQFAALSAVNHDLLIPSHISKDKIKQKKLVCLVFNLFGCKKLSIFITFRTFKQVKFQKILFDALVAQKQMKNGNFVSSPFVLSPLCSFVFADV